MEIKSLSDKLGWVPVIQNTIQRRRRACDPVMEGKVQVGGIKAPATRLKRRDLVQKLSKLEAKIAKLKELKKIEKCKRW